MIQCNYGIGFENRLKWLSVKPLSANIASHWLSDLLQLIRTDRVYQMKTDRESPRWRCINQHRWQATALQHDRGLYTTSSRRVLVVREQVHSVTWMTDSSPASLHISSLSIPADGQRLITTSRQRCPYLSTPVLTFMLKRRTRIWIELNESLIR